MTNKIPPQPDPIDKYYSRIVMLFMLMAFLVALLIPLATIGVKEILKAY